MVRRCIIFVCILLGIFITNIHCLEESQDNAISADIIITGKKRLQRIEVRNSSNATSTFSVTPTVIHQGNNLYVKPKFIYASPFSSYKQRGKSDNCCDNISVTSKVLDEERNIVIGKSPGPQVPTIIVPPVSVIKDYMWIPPPKFPVQSQTPIVIPNPYQNMPWLKVPNDIHVFCPPFVVPLSPNPPQLPRFPIVQKPVRPVVIPKPPELPPMILPKLPIQVLIKRPILTNPPVLRLIPDQPVIFPPLCPPKVNCIPPRQALPSISDIVSTIFEKFKNLLALPSRINVSNFFVPDDKVLPPDLVFPTVCAQGIIAERVVPNIVKNNELKVIMTPIFPSQFTHSSSYQK